MRASRGMGAINPSKMPKGKKVMRKDNKPAEMFAEGGGVGAWLRKKVGMETPGEKRKAQLDKAEADAVASPPPPPPAKKEKRVEDIQFRRGGKIRK